ncbi:phage major capsid protein [Pseudorhodoplanes sinuspersici]|uniref:Phage major capsid protein n=1 Tax=Pseudorhodoplanes sinuspersici TaxID=1235591 RepID=A0A1W6ZWL1_9HYPH|nr:phage major capsid protein [Pseudorhodoplanes sinuspersici]ARQ01706.1 phage major capsid protein [Pseudorhodoplanes sinuspersici]RKE73438.1 HK97 family phage major capsid protein [Pseudorhodoplanes sinuspersici]
MLESVKISRRQSEIRQALAGLVGKSQPTEDETRSMETLDTEYRGNETRYRASLIVEDTERREAGADLETRSDREYAELIGKFELRQVALHLDEGRKIDGATAEIVEELRSQGGYRGVPVPWQALEKRAGETIASGTPSPVTTAPIIDRIFADSAAVRMGASMVNIGQGSNEYPIASGSVTAGWADGETANVPGPTVYSTSERMLAPNSTLGIQMKITRKTLKQSGDGLEQAVRRDMNGAISVALDKAVFLGTGANGQPSGVLVGSYGITSTAVTAAASWSAFRAAVTRFLTANAANGPAAVKLLIRPEVWSDMDDTLIEGTAVSEWDRLVKNIPAGNIVMSSNALAAAAGSPLATKALLTTSVGGVAPIFVGTWGAIDLIRDVYSDAASGGLRLTALATADVTVSRAVQLEILTGIQ